MREGAQVKAGELVWGGVKSGVMEELEGAVEGHGDVVEGGEGGGWNSAQRTVDNTVNIHGSSGRVRPQLRQIGGPRTRERAAHGATLKYLTGTHNE
jgi:hypothetical protein